ncbi:pyruvate ferredoxin oxidoreductase [Candidatus Woesearchaeota archaeon]|nr:pyruvate ferredoxin oxidoreductase [Candidatus Woesearchaeota archaeon]
MKKVIEASMAVAIAAKLCKPDVVAVYPITPQTHIPERIADFVYDGEADIEMIDVESEHSALSACVGAQAAGSRTFTATASQGLALMHEVLFVASGLRLPIVMAVTNRTLSAPINIWNDHQDSISARDSGWMQFYVESAQEALDTVIIAYKIAEDHKVLLPAMICLDGFTLSHVYEPVDIPEASKVTKFISKYKPIYKLDTKKPMTFGPIGFPNSFMHFKDQQHEAMKNALNIIKKTNNDFKKQFGRSYGNGLIEEYKMQDAEYAVICMGTIAGTSRVVVDGLRKQGKKVGLIKIKTFRPFPEEELIRATKNLKAIAVIDKNISLGQQGAIYTDLKSTLYNKNKALIHSFIAGLGGRDIKKNHILASILKSIKAKKPSIMWMY